MTGRRAVLQLISALDVGGSERLLVDFVRAAGRDAAFPQIVAVMNDVVDEALLAALHESGCAVHLLRRQPGDRNPVYLFRLLRIIRANDVALIHAHNWGSKWWAALCRAALPRLRIVYTVHETGFITGYGLLARLLFRALVDRVIVPSAAAAADCRAIGLRAVSVVPNGVPLERFAPPKAGTSLPKLPRLIHVGRLSHAIKGQDVLVEALRLCAACGIPLACDLVGSPVADDPASLPHIERLVRDSGLQDSVRVLQGRTDIPDLLRAADVFVLPSRQEGFGLAALEAMAMRLPVVVSSVVGMHDYVRDGENALVFRDGDAQDLAEKIVRLLRDETLRAKLAEAGQRTAQRFDIGVMQRKYFEIYGDVLPH